MAFQNKGTFCHRRFLSPKIFLLRSESDWHLSRSSAKAFQRAIDQEKSSSQLKEQKCKPILPHSSTKRKQFSPKSSDSKESQGKHLEILRTFEKFEESTKENFNSEPNQKTKCNLQLPRTLDVPKTRHHENCVSVDSERSPPKTKSSRYKICEENSEFNESRYVFKPRSNKEQHSEQFERNFPTSKSPYSKQVRLTCEKQKYGKEYRAALQGCFANGLHSRKYSSSPHSFQTTSTPKAIKVKPKSQDELMTPVADASSVNLFSELDPNLPKSKTISRRTKLDNTPGKPTSIKTPVVLKTRNAPLVLNLNKPQRMVKSDTTPRVPKTYSSCKVPTSLITPSESEVSYTDGETSDSIAQDEKFERHELRKIVKPRSVSNNNHKTRNPKEIIYKPLFSNKPKVWKSLVVEND